MIADGPAPTPKITALAQWFGGNRTLAETVGDALGTLRWCGVPFCGSCAELPHIDTAAGYANDLHCHVINLARVIADDDLVERLVRRLDGLLCHAVELREAQARCLARSGGAAGPDVNWAADYFLACWMVRAGRAGARREFSADQAIRWISSGGDSVVRFRSAVESLREWHRVLRDWSFTCMDAFDFLDKARDATSYGLYVDAPWPDAGDDYQHTLTREQQAELAGILDGFTRTRIVVRYGDHPLIRELYPPPRWTWLTQTSRNQGNAELREALILNRPAANQLDQHEPLFVQSAQEAQEAQETA